MINWYYYKKIHIDIPLFWKNILRMSPVMLVMGTGAWFWMDCRTVDHWGAFFGWAAVYTVLYGVLSYFFMMNRYERDLCLTPVKKVVEKLCRRG